MRRTLDMRRTLRLSLALPAALLASAAGPAAADWLVTRDGARIETRGTWEVRGETVVFKTTNGTLSSLSVGDVDLDRSAALTAEREATPPAEPATAPKRVVISIDQDDIPRALPGARRASGASTTPSADGEGRSSPAAFAERLEITYWERTEPSWLDGVEVVGKITNPTNSTAMELALTVKVFDREGRSLAAERAFLESRSLLRNQTLGFRVPFEGVLDFETVEFEVSATEIVLGVGVIDEFDETLQADETGEEGGS